MKKVAFIVSYWFQNYLSQGLGYETRLYVSIPN